MPTRMPAFRSPKIRQRRGEDRPNAHQRGYCSKQHRAWRQAVLTRDAWQCQMCGRICSELREAQADHKVAIADGGARYDVANGQCLCLACHAKKGAAELAARAGRPKSLDGRG